MDVDVLEEEMERLLLLFNENGEYYYGSVENEDDVDYINIYENDSDELCTRLRINGSNLVIENVLVDYICS